MNNTQDQTGLQAQQNHSSAYQWRPNGNQSNMSTAYTWNVTIPELPGNSATAIYAVLPGDIILAQAAA